VNTVRQPGASPRVCRACRRPSRVRQAWYPDPVLADTAIGALDQAPTAARRRPNQLEPLGIHEVAVRRYLSRSMMAVLLVCGMTPSSATLSNVDPRGPHHLAHEPFSPGTSTTQPALGRSRRSEFVVMPWSCSDWSDHPVGLDGRLHDRCGRLFRERARASARPNPFDSESRQRIRYNPTTMRTTSEATLASNSAMARM
jgi:hypothetical protein